MNRLIIKSLLALMVIIVGGVKSAYADEKTCTVTISNYTPNSGSTTISSSNPLKVDPFEIYITKNSSENPGLYNNKNNLRFYSSDVLTIKGNEKVSYIKSITFTGTVAISSPTLTNKAWTTTKTDVTSVDFTGSGTNKITKIVIVYEDGTTSLPSLSKFSWSDDSANPFLDNTSYEFPTLTALDADGNAVTSGISYSSSDTEVATIDASTGAITLVDAGTTTIKASYAGNDTYQAAEATYSLEVRLHTASKFEFQDTEGNKVTEVNIVAGSEDGSYTLPTLYNSAGMTVTYSSSDDNIAVIDATGYLVETSKKGSTTITAKGKRYAYNDAEASYVINITAQTPEISFSKTEVDFDMGTQDEFYEPTLTTNSDGAVTYESSNTSVATVDKEGNVTIKATGTTTITANVAATDSYSSTSASYTITVTNSILGGSGEVTFDFTDEDELANMGFDLSQYGKDGLLFDDAFPSGSFSYKNISVTWGNGASTSTKIWKKTSGYQARIYQNGGALYFTCPNGSSISSVVVNEGKKDTKRDVEPSGNVVTIKHNNSSSSNIEINKVTITFVSKSSTQTVTIGTKGISSFCSKNALDFTSSTIKAWKATSVEGTTVKMEQVYKVPAKTGLLITGDEGYSEEIPILSEEPAGITGNMLVAAFKGSTIAHSTDEDYNYVFGTKNSVKGFYKLVENDMESNGNYAYLHSTEDYLATESGAKGLTFDFSNDATGISSVNSAAANRNAVYTISGQRVAQPTKPGLYIVNGKKIVVK